MGERIGLFGGSFDPIHRGHLDPVRKVAHELALDRVIYLPTGRPPHKAGPRHASAQARFTMVELALLAESSFQADAFELDASGAAYTIHTLEAFRRRNPNAQLFLLLGADSFLSLPRWYRWSQFPHYARLAVMVRPGYRLSRATDHRQLLALADGDAVRWVENEPLPVSSSEIRRRLTGGETLPDGWLPDLVARYINKYDLYGGNTAAP